VSVSGSVIGFRGYRSLRAARSGCRGGRFGLAARPRGKASVMAEGYDEHRNEDPDDADLEHLREAESEDPTSPERGFDDPEEEESEDYE